MSASLNEDVELRDLVMQVLESNGTMGKLKSQLRASVFLAMENSNSLKSVAATKDDSKVESLLKSSDGLDILGLCRDLLASVNLTYSLNVFDSEIKHGLGGSSLPTRSEIMSRLGISDRVENIPSSAPLLMSVVALQKNQALADRFAVNSDQISSARLCFSRFESLGCISYDQLLTALGSAFPSIEKRVLQNYCADQYQDVSSKNEANIDFEEFLSLYCYFLSIKNFSMESDDEKPKVDMRKKADNIVVAKVEHAKHVSEEKSSASDDKWSDDKDDDPLDLLPKIVTKPNARQVKHDLFAVDKVLDSLDLDEDPKKQSAPSTVTKAEKKSQSSIDKDSNPDEMASFFNEKPPWETEKDYADDFAQDEDGSPRKSQVEDDCKVTDLSDEDEDVTMDEAVSSDNKSSDKRQQHSPTSSASDFTLNVDSTQGKSSYSHLANHPRLANVQFLEDVESTKF